MHLDTKGSDYHPPPTILQQIWNIATIICLSDASNTDGSLVLMISRSEMAFGT